MSKDNFFNDLPAIPGVPTNDPLSTPTTPVPTPPPGIAPFYQVGSGDTVFRVDQNGMWLGARRFIDAPFKVSMTGVVTISAPNAAWVAVSFLNSWVDYGGGYNPVAYLIDSAGFVHLRGMAKSGTVGAGTPIFTLPAGFRPENRCLFNAQSNGALGRVDVFTTGNVEVITGNNAWVSLDGITFKAFQ